MKILITGAAGFIGFHLIKKLVKQNQIEIVGIDNINNYYDVSLKYARLDECGITQENISPSSPIRSSIHPNYTFIKTDIADYNMLCRLFEDRRFDIVINMAAQAGVRYSIENPQSYVQSNLIGFANILECCRHYQIKHLIYASSSSVYGMNNSGIFREDECVDYPVSFYAATKKSNELMAHSYSHLFHIPTTGVRLFTAYGPWGRPDMAPMLFAKAIYKHEPIRVFNNGDMQRDFTYVEDIAESIIRLIDQAPTQQEEHPYYRILNIGNSAPVELLDFIHCLEKNIGEKALLEMYPMQPGDVKTTYADTSRLQEVTQYRPQTSLEQGIAAFIDWYRNFYKK